MTKETTKASKEKLNKQKKSEKTLSNTFALFKDFARFDKYKARLAN